MSQPGTPASTGIRAGIAIHGGAGTIRRAAISPEQEAAYLQALQNILRAGERILAAGGSALDAVTEAVRLLEECPLFNAGRGAVFTSAGTHELDAAIMDGSTLRAGAVACVSRIRNPILAARKVMEQSKHVLLASSGAEAFAQAQGLEMVAADFFSTEARYQQLLKAQAEHTTVLDHDGAMRQAVSSDAGEPLDPDRKFGTVGAVALDLQGRLAAATSTGGMTNKMPGRVGDTPMLGAGCYANARTAALSATGTGESFMRSLALHDVSAQMEYGQRSLEQAARDVVFNKLPQCDGQGGLIAIDTQGNINMPFNTEGMYRGQMHVGGEPLIAIYGE
jgi:beta-aspartyl-peptidase (threonine type)